jgi:hypothetical protein
MGGKPRLRTFVVWLSNRTDCRDDEPHRVKARTHEEAKESLSYSTARFDIGGVYTLSEFYARHPEWRGVPLL